MFKKLQDYLSLLTIFSGVQRTPDVSIIFVNNLGAYLKDNPDVQLTPFNYSKTEGFTLGQKGDNKLLDLTYTLDGFNNNSYMQKKETYAYDYLVFSKFEYIQLSCENTTRKGEVFLKSGEIGEGFVSLVVEVGRTENPHLTCNVKLYGDLSVIKY